MWASQVARLGSIRLQKPVSSERLDELSESIGSEGGAKLPFGPLPNHIEGGRTVELPRDKVLSVPETKELSRRRVLNNKGGPACRRLAANDQIASERRFCLRHGLREEVGETTGFQWPPLCSCPAPPDWIIGRKILSCHRVLSGLATTYE